MSLSDIDAQIKYIALSMSVPYRIFIRTEEAKLSSTQDINTMNKRITKRQGGYFTPMLLRPLIDRLIAFGVLPDIEEYFIEWQPFLYSREKGLPRDVGRKKFL